MTDIKIEFDNDIELDNMFDITQTTGALPMQSKTVTLGASTPSSVLPSSGYGGLNQVNFSLDSSVIKAENIAEGTSILGINGTHHSGITPTGTLSINANGNYDVTNYANASVSVGGAEPNLVKYIIEDSSPFKLIGMELTRWTRVPAMCFQNLNNNTDVTVVDCNIEFIDSYGFGGNNKLTTASFHRLVENIVTLGDASFTQCDAIDDIVLPATLNRMGASVFYGDDGLRSVRFLGTPVTISSNAFNFCPNLTNIYVPWSEGAVAGAPWGATNATVHYNS